MMYSKGGRSQEKYLERKLVEWVNSIKGRAVKGPSYTDKGIPDRIVILPNGGGTVWVEVKGGTYYQLEPMQKWWRDLIINSSPDRYFLIDTKEDLDKFITTCEGFMVDTKKSDML